MPFVGTPARACRRAWDKPTAKDGCARAGLDTPEWIALPHTTFRALGAQAVLDAMVDRLGLPLMLKPHQGGSALGAQVVSDARRAAGRHGELPRLRRHRAGRAVRRRRGGRGHGGRGRGCPARAARRRGRGRRAGSTTTPPATPPAPRTSTCPARIDAATAARAGGRRSAAHQLLGLRDVSRTDADGRRRWRVQFLEVNVSPGLTDTSLLPTAGRGGRPRPGPPLRRARRARHRPRCFT